MVTRRQRRIAGLTCLVLFFLSASCAEAWEFSVSTNFTWEFFQFSQLGFRGFFGQFNKDSSSVAGTLNLAARNGWVGHEITGDNIVSGSDAAANYIFTTFYPLLKVNKALSLQGSYRIGSWADPSQDTSLGQLNASRYLNSQAPGIERSFSPGYWNTWYVAANLPWGAVTIGKQPNTLSLGFTIDTSEDTCEGVNFSLPFGPFSFGGQYYFWGPGKYVNYPVKTDRSGSSQPHFTLFLLYDSGNVSAHNYIEYSNGHQGPESQLFQTGRINFRAEDTTSFFGFSNFRYFDGRFFFNAEVGFRQDILRQSRSESNVLLPRTRYWELWGGMIELGGLAGPAKISFLWAYYPGPDRRAGQLIDRQPFIPGPMLDSGVNVYRPYSLLLGYDYGSGNNSITGASSHGFITDASTYGVRLDYAVAANLNTYTTFLYSQRLSQGYGWGWIRPNPSTTPTPTSPALQYGLIGPFEAPLDFSFTSGAPNILDRELGYEIGFGIDWKLIEGYLLRAQIAYWKPGAWFNYACVDRTQPSWDIPDASNSWGINPKREIDPIFGTRMSLELAF